MGQEHFDFRKNRLKIILLSFGENELANKVDVLTENDMVSIGQLATKYKGQSSVVDKMIACGAIEFFEKSPRPLKREMQDMKFYDVDD